VLSNEVLAKVWMGTITTWNHADIAGLNPNATLPANDITLVFSEAPSSVEMSAVLARALSSVSEAFRTALGSGGGSLSGVVPSSAIAASGTDGRLAFVKVRLPSA
jgi:ABC-type phosphate transport system substrate-binding protein